MIDVVLVAGPRIGGPSADTVAFHLDQLLCSEVVVMTGGEVGTARLVRDYCMKSGLKHLRIAPAFITHPHREFHEADFFSRNQILVDNADRVIVFDNGDNDTKDIIRRAKKAGRPLTILSCEEVDV